MKITAVHTFPVTLPVRPEYFIASSAGTHAVSRYVVLAIETDDGTTGWGEASVVPLWSGESQGGAIALIQDYFAPLLLHRSLDEVDLGELDRIAVDNHFTKAAVEMALWDLKGRHCGKPVYELLGGARNPLQIPIKFSIGLRSPEEAAAIAAEKVRQGFTAIKIKVGPNPEEDLRRVAAVREAIGPATKLNVDVNGGWSVDQAIREIPRYAPFHLEYVEQPTPRWDIDGLARVRTAVNVPIMADETVFSVWQAEQVIAKKAADLISIYPGKNGGLLKAQQICRMAEEAGIRCHLGSNLEWDIGTAAMCHLAAACSNVPVTDFPVDILGHLYYAVHPKKNPVEFQNGRVLVPQGPGLGMDLDRDEIEALLKQSHAAG
ncbi:MAG TPA: enolase C-terminal domain-like protein [Verrucomicrobiota bacterium]|nr:enolase C-terminal domain-like protein [Verrucomicrobiota bacterium]